VGRPRQRKDHVRALSDEALHVRDEVGARLRVTMHALKSAPGLSACGSVGPLCSGAEPHPVNNSATAAATMTRRGVDGTGTSSIVRASWPDPVIQTPYSDVTYHSDVFTSSGRQTCHGHSLDVVPADQPGDTGFTRTSWRPC